MTDVQLHQEYEKRSQAQAQAAPKTTASAQTMNPYTQKPRRFRFVPAAIICAIVVVGALIGYRTYQQKDSDLTADMMAWLRVLMWPV